MAEEFERFVDHSQKDILKIPLKLRNNYSTPLLLFSRVFPFIPLQAKLNQFKIFTLRMCLSCLKNYFHGLISVLYINYIKNVSFKNMS